MAETDREEAQRRRADARRRRRGEDRDQPGGATNAEPDTSGDDEPLDTVKHAAKVAAAAAAVGAAVGAARALTGDGADEPEARPDVNDEAEPTGDEPSEPEAREEQPAADEAEVRPDEEEEGRQRAASPEDAERAAARAREHLETLVGKEADSVSGLERTDEGWRVTLEVVEVSRIPASTDVLASYEVELDGDGNLVRYHRGGRYYRSQAGGGESS